MANAVEALQKALAESADRERRLRQELADLRQRYADDLFTERQMGKQRQAQLHQLQDNYELLRVRKGGFGFKMLTITGLAATAAAVLLCWLYIRFKPRADHPALFRQFKTHYQFNVEYALSQRQYQEAQRLLEEARQQTQYRAIEPEVEFARKLVQAAEQGCQER